MEFDEIESRYRQISQLRDDLGFDAKHTLGAWFDAETHLHVHVGIPNGGITLDVAKNVCVLYGLFENEIESRLPLSQKTVSGAIC